MLEKGDNTVSLGLQPDGGGTRLYNKLIFTELLEDQEANEARVSSTLYSGKTEKTGVLDGLAKRRSLGIPSYPTSNLSPAGRELINREKSNLYNYSDCAMNVLTARGMLVG